METVISFTPAQLWACILGICGGVSAIAACINWIVKGHRALKAPEARQDERLTSLEKRVAEHDEYFRRDKLRLEMIEEGNRVTQRALRALLAHGLDGNETVALKKAKEDLEEYLISR